MNSANGPRQGGEVRGAEQRLHHGDQFLGLRLKQGCALLGQIGTEDGLAGEGLAELDVVLLAHSFEPVEPVRFVRRNRCEARDRDEPLITQRGSGEQWGPPPEMPHEPYPASESASAIASRSAAHADTSRPAARVEPP